MFESWDRDMTRQHLGGVKKQIDQRVKGFTSSPGGMTGILRNPTFQLLLSYLRPRLPSVLLIGAFNVVKTVLEAGRIVVLLLLLDFILGSSDNSDSGTIHLFGMPVSLPFLSEWTTAENGLIVGIGLLVALTLCGESVTYCINHMICKLQAVFSYEIRQDFFSKLLNLDMGYFSDQKFGTILYYETPLIGRFSSLLPTIQNISVAAIDLLMVMAILFTISGAMTVLLGIMALGLMLVVNRLGRIVKRKSQEFEEASRLSTANFAEAVYGVRLIKQGRQEARALQKYLDLAWDRERKTVRLADTQNVSKGITRFGGIAALLLVVATAKMLAGMNMLENLGLGLGFLYLIMRVFRNVETVQGEKFRLASMVPQFMIIAEFLLDRENDEKMGETNLPALQPIVHDLSVDSLGFSYTDGQQVLNDVSIKFQQGMMTALVGLSGSGKTTLLEVLAGFRDPGQGRIMADDADISLFQTDSYRQMTGYVNQETVILNDKLIENLRFLRPDAPLEQVEKAVELAAAKEFVSEAEHGYETMVGERGMKISGGQRQRIAIARVLLQDPDILLLDEATSSLDLYTEAQIYANLMKMKKDRITIVAAHRLSAITHFDNIVVFNKGKVVEQGPHLDLMLQKGLYYHLYSLQEYTADFSAVTEILDHSQH